MINLLHFFCLFPPHTPAFFFLMKDSLSFFSCAFFQVPATKYVENAGARQVVTLVVLALVVSGAWDTFRCCRYKEIRRRKYMWQP